MLFTNRSAVACTLRGYPSALLLRGGTALGSPARHDPGRIRTITLKPKSGRAQVQLTAVSTCNAPISDHVRVRLPGSPTSTAVPMELRGCSLSVAPIEPG